MDYYRIGNNFQLGPWLIGPAEVLVLDRLQTMKVFITVIDEGSFTAAARRLGMTVPHVTRHIAALETELSTRLLQRTTRRMSLTPAGARYAERVREILVAVETATQEVQHTSSALRGALRIVVAPSLTDTLIAPLAAAFRAEYPQLMLELHVDADPLPDLSKYDLGFLRVAEGFDANIVARTLFTSESILCAAPSYLARHGTPSTPQELGQHWCVLRRAPERHRDSFALWRSGQRVTTPPEHEVAITPAVTASFTASLIHMVLDGAGIATFTQETAQPYLKHGLLQQVLPGWITGRYSVLAALPSHKHLPDRTKVFLDFLTAAQQTPARWQRPYHLQQD